MQTRRLKQAGVRVKNKVADNHVGKKVTLSSKILKSVC